MRLTATIEAKGLADHVWQGNLRAAPLPDKGPSLRRGLPTILVVRGAVYSADQGQLSFDFNGIEVLNRGDDARAIILAAVDSEEAAIMGGPDGDQAYLSLLDRLPAEIRKTGRDLLERIRELDPDGTLEQRGRRFVNRPDNFVALEPQTRLNEIIVHLRGIVTSKLRPVSAQRGYSAFKVADRGDLLEAGSALGRAKRRF